MGVIMIFFTAYSIMQYFLYKAFFEKAQYTLKVLVNFYSRRPYLTAAFNALREGIMKGTTEVGSKGIQ